MKKVRFDTWPVLSRSQNPPLKLFDQQLIEELQTAVNQAMHLPLRALMTRADGKVFIGRS